MKKLFLIGISVIVTLHAFTQNIGIGTSVPDSKLQINNNGVLRPGLKLFDSAANSGYPVIQFQNAGGSNYWQIGGNMNNVSSIGSFFDIYSSQSGGYLLTVRGDGNVGIGRSTPQSKLDVNGDINVTGALKVAGNSGTAGQVLLSNGTAAPAWQNAALSNNTRFSTSMSSNGSNSGFMPLVTLYNLNPANITIGSNFITINHTGLYHFEGNLIVSVAFGSPPAPFVEFSFLTSSSSYNLMRNKKVEAEGTSTTVYSTNQLFSIDIHLIAGDNVQLSKSIAGVPGGAILFTGGWFTGYLISD